MLRRKHERDKVNWEKYRKYRNYTVKLRKTSIRKYIEICTVNAGSPEFWKTIKPLISDKMCVSDNITLLENDVIVNKPDDVCNIMNNYFVNMAGDIGSSDCNRCITTDTVLNGIIDEYESHESVQFIRNNHQAYYSFEFAPVTSDCVYKLTKLNVKKSTGLVQIIFLLNY